MTHIHYLDGFYGMFDLRGKIEDTLDNLKSLQLRLKDSFDALEIAMLDLDQSTEVVHVCKV